jgi:hypothetical protein
MTPPPRLFSLIAFDFFVRIRPPSRNERNGKHAVRFSFLDFFLRSRGRQLRTQAEARLRLPKNGRFLAAQACCRPFPFHFNHLGRLCLYSATAYRLERSKRNVARSAQTDGARLARTDQLRPRGRTAPAPSSSRSQVRLRFRKCYELERMVAQIHAIPSGPFLHMH